MAEYVELNLSNYDSEDVEQLNAWAMEAVEAIDNAVPVLSEVLQLAGKTPQLHSAVGALITEFNRLSAG